ncbi:MAG: permease, partial [Erythrobacter sp.]|nr:permease [Erythrobacter sp.]
MDVYLPIANLSVNGLYIVLLGGLTGILSGLFGVGGGFLTTPLLIFYGIPPTVAAASAATQVTGASVSGVLAHSRRKGVDYRMGAVLVVGGMVGALIGAALFSVLQALGQIDFVISILYVLLLGSIGTLMMREALSALRPGTFGTGAPVRKRRHHPLVASLPYRWRFYASGLYISPLAPLILGMLVGILTMLMGVGGGFLLVPAMLYILGMSANVVVGTSLFQILFVTMLTTMTHALTTKAVDLVLAALLLLGSV